MVFVFISNINGIPKQATTRAATIHKNLLWAGLPTIAAARAVYASHLNVHSTVASTIETKEKYKERQQTNKQKKTKKNDRKTIQ